MSRLNVNEITNATGSGPVDFPQGVVQRLSAGAPALLDASARVPAARLPISGALTPRGTWDASTGSYPSSPPADSYWFTSVAGTVSGINYAVGDQLIRQGGAWHSVPVNNSYIDQQFNTLVLPPIHDMRNTKAAAGGLSKTVGTSLVLAAPIVLGTADFDIYINASCVPRGDTSGDCLLGMIEYSSGLLVMRRNDGQWFVRDLSGVAMYFPTYRRIIGESLVRLCRDGNWITLYINGQSLGSIDATGIEFGTLAYIGSRTAAGTEFGWLGNLRNLSVFNRVLNADEDAGMLASGGQIIPVGARPLLPVGEVIYQSDFSSGLNDWNPSAAVIATANATVGEVSAALLIEVTAASPTATLQYNFIPNSDASWNGQYLVELDVYFPEENTTVVGLIIGNPSGDLTPYQRHAPLAKGQWHRVKSVANGLTGSFNSFMYGTNAAGTIVSVAGDKWAVKNMRVTRVGCVLDLPMDDGAGYQLHTRFGSRGPVLLPAIGVTHLLPGQRFEFVWSRVSSGFLGDADRPVLPDGAVIESVIWEDAKGTKTTGSLGYNASNTATHVASFTPAQARQPATLTAGSMATTDRRLYLNMSANAGAVTVRVAGRIL